MLDMKMLRSFSYKDRFWLKMYLDLKVSLDSQTFNLVSEDNPLGVTHMS